MGSVWWKQTILLILMVMASGCLVKPYVLTKDDVRTRVTNDMKALMAIEEPVIGPIDLYEATARALKYNLEARVKAMQAQLAHQQLNVAHYTLLPQISANAGFDGRNNFSGGGAQSLLDGRPVLEPFTSSDKNVTSGNLALSWDVLDFGLPLTPLNYRRELLYIQSEVQRLYRELSTARTQLASMMGLPPGTPYELTVPVRTGHVPLVNLDTESMEKQALMFRAELRSIDYQKRISAKEARAVFLELFPSLKLSFGGYYNSNSFFLYQNWLGYAAQTSWNLLSAFRTPAKLKAVEAHREVLESQSLALTMAILTEVHVGAVQFVHAKQEFQNARQYHETQSAIAEHTRNLWLTRSTNDLTLIKERVNDVLAEVRLDSAQSGVETAYATLMASLGEDAVPAGLGAQSVADLAGALKKLWEPAGLRTASAERRSEIHATSVAR